MAKCIWKPNNNIILGLFIVQDLLVRMGMSAHIYEGTHTCMYICMLGKEVHTHEGTDACVYIYGCVHIYVRHTCLCIMVNMPVETHLILFFSSCRKSPWLGTQSLTDQCSQSSEVSVSPVLGTIKIQLTL